MSEPTARAVPFYCPYCGEESIRPAGEDLAAAPGQWRCADCLRAFSLRYAGLTRPPQPASPTT